MIDEDLERTFKIEILGERERGRNLTLLPCYPDTCVLINAFLEDPNNPQYTTPQNIEDAKSFFRLFDGPYHFFAFNAFFCLFI